MGTTAESLRQDLDRERADLATDLEAIGDRVSPGRMVDRRKASARQKISGVREQLMGTVHDMKHSASDAGNTVREAPEKAQRVVEGNPLGVGIAAFGIGLVIATLLPETDTEQRLVAQVQPRFEEAARDVAQEVVEQVKPAAMDAVQEIKSDAQGAAGKVKEKATDAASNVTEQAKDKAQEVRDQVKQ